jgi:hypothetical protein
MGAMHYNSENKHYDSALNEQEDACVGSRAQQRARNLD